MADETDEIDAGEGAEPIIDPKDLKASRGWLALISKGEKAYREWQDKADAIDRLYANLERLAAISRERQFQLFWANIEVLGPSIYSRPPQPVVTTRFKDQRPLPRTASELLERATVVTFETQDLDYVMRKARDDLNIVARGAVWIRYEAAEKGSGNLGQRVCIEHVDRQDFVHDPVRNWKEVDWVSKGSWLTRKEARARFRKSSGDAYKNAAYEIRKDDDQDSSDGKLKARFWELWSKSLNKVVWVSEGCDKVLDEGPPHLELQDFFPCPRPAYGTTQRRSLIPVPDMLFYKDQLEEINEITGRIAALTEALRLKGFYPGGASELAEAIELAIKSNNDNAIIIPVNNWALFGTSGAKDTIVWLPLEMVANTITELIALRKELIGDVYQIMGLSDIMRGQTDSNETLGAQQLKSQYGSVRIRDKKDELVRLARDITRISAEIMSENFTSKSLLDMSQMDIPSDADIAKQKKPLEQQLKALQKELADAQKDPEIQQMVKANPDQAKEIMGQVQQQTQQLADQITKLDDTVTIEQVMKFLRDNRTRAFTLDIETDSTVAPDENEQKQRMTEYVTAMSGLLQQIVSAVEKVPQAAPLAGEIIKAVNSTFRVGRGFEQVVEEFTDQMRQIASAPKNEGPTPEQMKAEAATAALQAKQQSDAQRAQIEAGKAQAAAAKDQAAAALAQAELQLRQKAQESADAIAAAKLQGEQQAKAAQIEADKWKAQLQAVTAIKVAMIGAKTDLERVNLEAELEKLLGIQEHQHEIETMTIEHAHDAQMQSADQAHQVDQTERTGEQAKEQAALKPKPTGD